MMLMIMPERRREFEVQLDEMHRLRYRVFKNRLDWNVDARDGKEKDEFDELASVYLLLCGDDGHIRGCVRMLPCTGATMLAQVFPVLLGSSSVPVDARVWESSRFALDLSAHETKVIGGLTQATYELFQGMVEFGISKSLTDIVTVTDLRVERILRRAGWPLRRIHEPKIIGGTTAIAGYLEISLRALTGLRNASGITSPVLWQPVIQAIDCDTGAGNQGHGLVDGLPYDLSPPEIQQSGLS